MSPQAKRAPKGVRGGIDLGGTKIEAIVVDGTHTVRGQARRPTPTSGGPEAVAAALIEVMREACGAAEIAADTLAGIGVGSPGLVDTEQGTVSAARNLPDWEGTFPLGPAVADRLGVAVRVGNDVQVAIDGEYALGAGRPYRSLLGVFWGTGIGGGLILDGRPWHGRGGAGEIGHTVVRVGGARCPCGRRGCLEAYAGRAAMEARVRRKADRGERTELFDLARKHGRDRLTSGIWARALERGDRLAHATIERAVTALGAGIASAVNLLDVESVIIGGGLGIRFGEPYVRRIEAAMRPHLFRDAAPPDVLLAGLGDLGGALGAALLVADLAAARGSTPRRPAD